MARLIEIQRWQDIPGHLTVKRGDVLLFRATGGYVKSGTETVATLGHFVSGVLANNGELLFPAGTPDTVLFQARERGRATIGVVTGDPFREPRTTTLDITVEL
jgi:hypothetical protein